ncbi:MAG TPA: glycosyltransferase family 39 protein [Candidatus Binatia bacterium]|nr:glycosyltransferase family 39 protein [Candidatus Binatia bacterium]
MTAPALGRRGFALVAFAASVTMLVRLWEGDLFRDEVLYAAIAKGVAVRGEWLDLWVGDTPYWNKPPLVFWLVAATFRVLGTTVLAAKLVPALFGILSCVALYAIARRLTDERLALLAGLVLATTPRFVRTSATFRLDSAVTFFTLWSLWAYVRGAEDGRRGAFLTAGLAWGLGVMAKGVFGLTGPYLFLIWCAVMGRLRVVATWPFVASVLVGAAVCLPWHLWEVHRWGAPFVDVYLRRQVIGRMAGELWHGPAQSYFAVLLKDDWLWVAFLALGVVSAAARAWRGDRRVLFVLCWAAGYLALLYASQGRRARYLLQFYPPAAVLTALGIARVVPAAWLARLPRAATVAFAAAAVVLLVVPIPLHSSPQRDLRALRPVLDRLDGGTQAPVDGFREMSPNGRGAFLFYLDRDLHGYPTIPALRRGTAPLVVAKPDAALVLDRHGWERLFTNARYVVFRRPGR